MNDPAILDMIERAAKARREAYATASRSSNDHLEAAMFVAMFMAVMSGFPALQVPEPSPPPPAEPEPPLMEPPPVVYEGASDAAGEVVDGAPSEVSHDDPPAEPVPEAEPEPEPEPEPEDDHPHGRGRHGSHGGGRRR